MTDSSGGNSPTTSMDPRFRRRSSLYTKHSPSVRTRHMPQPSKTALLPITQHNSHSPHAHMSNLARELHRTRTSGEVPPPPPLPTNTHVSVTPPRRHRSPAQTKPVSRSLPPTPMNANKSSHTQLTPHMSHTHVRHRHQPIQHASIPVRPLLTTTTSLPISPAMTQMSPPDSAESSQTAHSKHRSPQHFSPPVQTAHIASATGTHSSHNSPRNLRQSHAHFHFHGRVPPPQYASQHSAPASSSPSTTSSISAQVSSCVCFFERMSPQTFVKSDIKLITVS